MPGSLSSKLESQTPPEPYFTSSDLRDFETVLNGAMAEATRSGGFGDDEGAQTALRLRLAAAILRFASLGERDPDALLRMAIRSLD